MSDTEDFVSNDMFAEPEGYFKELPPAHLVKFTRTNPTCPGPLELELDLVGSSPLWGHLLWNAGKATADYLEKHRADLVTGKTVLELGAGAGLPSVISALSAKKVVVTDYPDVELVDNLKKNRDKYGFDSEKLDVRGYIWGEPIDEFATQESFDLVILSDLVFNHTEHQKLIKTTKLALKKDTGRALVVFSPHRPKLLQKDLEFFETAKDHGFVEVDKFELDYTPMFEEDAETAELRGKVFGYLLKLPNGK